MSFCLLSFLGYLDCLAMITEAILDLSYHLWDGKSYKIASSRGLHFSMALSNPMVPTWTRFSRGTPERLNLLHGLHTKAKRSSTKWLQAASSLDRWYSPSSCFISSSFACDTGFPLSHSPYENYFLYLKSVEAGVYQLNNIGVTLCS